MANATVQVNSHGWNIDLTMKDQTGTVRDLSQATSLEYICRKPKGDRVVLTPVFVTDGSDGKLRYTVVAGNVDQVGEWKLQARATSPTVDFLTDILTFNAEGNL